MPKVAIVGTGRGTRVQVPTFRPAGLETVGLWARSKEKGARVAAVLSIPICTTVCRPLLDNSEIDLISITTPPSTHAEMAIAALEAGKHVLCEKPTALNAAQAEEMLSAAGQHPKQLALIDHQLRFLPYYQKMRALIKEGYVGKVLYVEGLSIEDGMLNPKIHWHWWHNVQEGGGRLGAVGSHLIDLTTWLVAQPVRAVEATLRTFVSKRKDGAGITREVTSDDFFDLHLNFSDDAEGFLRGSDVTAGKAVHSILVAGSDGSLHWQAGELEGYRSETKKLESLAVHENIQIPQGLHPTQWVKGSVYLGRALRDVLEHGNLTALAPAATFTDGLNVQRALDAARQSSVEHNRVSIL